MKKCISCGELIGDSVTGNCPICFKPAIRNSETTAISNKGINKMTNEEIMKVVKPVICSQLKSPASAQFPVDLISIVGDDERGYQVSGFVDSPNSYGAMLRTDFEAAVVVLHGAPVIKSSSVGIKTNEQRTNEFVSNFITISILTGIGGAILYFIISMMVGL